MGRKIKKISDEEFELDDEPSLSEADVERIAERVAAREAVEKVKVDVQRVEDVENAAAAAAPMRKEFEAAALTAKKEKADAKKKAAEPEPDSWWPPRGW